MKKIFYLIIIFQCTALLPAQSLSPPERLRRSQIAADIAEKSAFWGESSLWFFNADTGKFLSGLQVDIPNIGSFTTNADGVVSFPTPSDGTYTFTAFKQGFMVLEDSFRVLMEGILFYKYSIPPITDLNYVKIVLDWGQNPQDLDLHVEKENQYHISYWAMKKAADGTAWLDRDDVSGFGPETVTITKIDNNAVYRIYVHNYTNKNQPSGTQLSNNSQAVVRIYNDNRLKEAFTITKGRQGVYWDVFEISRGQIRRVNNYR